MYASLQKTLRRENLNQVLHRKEPHSLPLTNLYAKEEQVSYPDKSQENVKICTQQW